MAWAAEAVKAKAKALKAKAVKAKVVKAKAAEAEAELKVKAVKVAVKAMDVTAAMVEAEVWRQLVKNCSGSDDGGSKRRQRDLLESLLAGQLVEDQLARGPTPGRTVLICSSRSVEQH